MAGLVRHWTQYSSVSLDELLLVTASSLFVFLGSTVGKSLKCKASPFISFWGILLEKREWDDEILLVMSRELTVPANRHSSPSMWHPFSPSPGKNRHTTLFDLCSSSALKHPFTDILLQRCFLPRAHQIIVYLSGSPTHLLHNPSWWANGGLPPAI